MTLHRLRLRPRSPWRTPWQADTLAGALCNVAARTHGPDFLRTRLIDPMLAGEPPFVLSDAFPGDLLPLPVACRLADLPGDADRKARRRGRWLSRSDFLRARGASPEGRVPWDRVWQDSEVFLQATTRHNTLARDSDASLEEGGLFARSDTHLRTVTRHTGGRLGGSIRTGSPDTHLRTVTRHTGAASASSSANLVDLPPNPALGGCDGLTLYFRVRDVDSAGLLLDLLYELSLTGFGADIATGRGQFDLAADPEPAADIDSTPAGADGVVTLSTFQPAPGDPADGFWEAFPKFGRLGPDLGLSDVRKHTLIMLRPGACLRVDPARPFLGRALPMDDVLPSETCAQLRARGVEVIHPAFGLAVPARMPAVEGFTA